MLSQIGNNIISFKYKETKQHNDKWRELPAIVKPGGATSNRVYYTDKSYSNIGYMQKINTEH